jgi:hypothetical protein
MSWYRVRNYNLELESSLWGIDDDEDKSYSVEFDGLVTNREQIKVLADLIRQLHSDDIMPIVAVFKPRARKRAVRFIACRRGSGSHTRPASAKPRK